MNIKEIEDCFTDNFDKTKEIKQIMKHDTFNLRTRKLHLTDKNYTGVSIKHTFRDHIPSILKEYDFYIIRNKQYIGHSFILLSTNEYKYYVLNRKNIDESKISKRTFSDIGLIKHYIIDVLKDKKYFWWV